MRCLWGEGCDVQRFKKALPSSPAAPVQLNAPQIYRERPPADRAVRHVSSVWVQHIAAGAAPYTHRTVPHGSIEVAVELGSSPRVVGPQTAPVVARLAPGTTVVGVRFHPGAAPSLLGVPASELVDLDVGADELLGRWASELGDAVAAAASSEDAAAIVERAIVDRIADAPALDPIVAEAVRRLRPWSADDVGSVASSLFISERQLRRRMGAAIGLAPKAVQLILRFQGFLAFAHTRASAGPELAVLAAETGYADQSHLTRESLRLSGLSPRSLLRESVEHCFGVHDHAASWVPLLRTRA
jgi:AraC-like DNA-binding protein